MKIITTQIHALLDYTVALFLIALPWLFSFQEESAPTWTLVGSGLCTICYSLFTRYELSMAAIIPLPAHLLLDTLSGIFLVASPWVFGFYQSVYLPHLLLGILELTVVLLTRESSRVLNKKSHVPLSY